MELHTLQAAEGSRKVRNRVGRGTSSGNGKTSGRGQKGQKSRSGGGVRPGFEGGQTPLFRRMPKRGFLNVNRKEYAIVNLDTLNRFEAGAEVNATTLVDAKIIKSTLDGIKVLGNGELKVKNLKLTVAKISESAKAAVEAAGGSVELVEAKKFVKAAK
ncbi:MAG: 50S ribosomal protein L15 [Streptococcaceae bacterium]|jgi:large subunit ribosomal protein L15|nr:50S ribosomal protein L15 [Streptococcaceae bacterium]